MLLAFSAGPEELEVMLLSLTFGNIDVQRFFDPLIIASQYLNYSRVHNSHVTAVSATLFLCFITSRKRRNGEGRLGEPRASRL